MVNSLEIGQCASCHGIFKLELIKQIKTGSEWIQGNGAPQSNYYLKDFYAPLCNECIGRIEMYN